MPGFMAECRPRAFCCRSRAIPSLQYFAAHNNLTFLLPFFACLLAWPSTTGNPVWLIRVHNGTLRRIIYAKPAGTESKHNRNLIDIPCNTFGGAFWGGCRCHYEYKNKRFINTLTLRWKKIIIRGNDVLCYCDNWKKRKNLDIKILACVNNHNNNMTH